ncbi:hypothetical protein LEN26_017780 [Aphanomyces euteiches]|nr:hypothetical protein LEN26_017780 [Aphanomyces euteiches]
MTSHGFNMSKVLDSDGGFSNKTVGSPPYVLECKSECGSEFELFEGDGALQPGGAFPLLSRESLGLLVQYAGVGFISGMLPSLAYPVFTVYLRMEGYQIASYNQLVNLAWSLKLFPGILSDCFPIYGYKRKPYIFIGWILALICCLAKALTPFPPPHYGPETKGKNLSALTPNETALYVNLNSAADGYQFILWSMVAAFGYIIADVAADAMMVQHAQREPLHMRGRIQTMIYTVRECFRIIPNFFIGVGLNSYVYGGTFDFSVEPNVMYWLLVAACVSALLASYFLVVETPTPPAPFRQYIQGLWDLIQLRVMWQVCLFRFLLYLSQKFDATPHSVILKAWVNATPVVSSMYTASGYVVTTITYFTVGRIGLGWNWRTSIVASTVLAVLIDGSTVFATIWCEDARLENLFLSMTILVANIPIGVQFLIGSYSTVELADMGNEGAVHGLVSTLGNFAAPIAGTIFKTVDSYFVVDTNTIKSDTNYACWQVTYTFIIAKRHLKRRGKKDPIAGYVTVVAFVVLLVYQFVVGIFSLFPSTWCWHIAGGTGVPVGKTTCQ